MFDPQSRLPLRRTRQQKSHTPALSRTWRLVATITLIALASVYVAFAATSLSASIPNTQNFDAMGIPLSSPAISSLPVEFRQDTRSIARSVGSYSSASLQTNLAGGASLSSTATNGSYNFGAGTSTLGDSDRAVGFLSTGAGGISGNLYARFQNNTGSPLSGLVISYDVEKYRNGSNIQGFRYQLFHSSDGVNWTNAGPGFFTAFPGDANDNGFATAPGQTQSVVNKTLNVSVANGANIFLAWNYSVVAGNNPSSGQALAIDNISVLGVGTATNPSGVGTANPNSVLPNSASTLTVTVTPGANPTSTGLTVTADLSSIGGLASQQFFDDGATGGDLTPADNVFTCVATVAPVTAAGPKSLSFSVTDAQSRSATGSISLTVQQPPPPITDLGPSVAGNDPTANGFNAPYDATVTVDFSEPVDVIGNWFDITCANSGQHNSATVASYNSSKGFHITPNTSFQFGEQCIVTIFRGNVHDQDLDDSSPNTDTLFADHSWTFTVVAAGAPAPHPPGVHLAMGNPSNALAHVEQFNNYLMEKPSFALSYNRDKGTPNWVSWHLENDWTGSLPRTDTFRADPAVPADWYRVQSTDYAASGFNRGEMTPNVDRDNPAAIPLNQEAFLMSNMVPQAPDTHEGPWANFENFLRTLLPANELYIVAGPQGAGGLGNNGPATTIANGRVTVPAHTWKVVLVLPQGENDISRVNAATRTIAVLVPNLNGIDSNWEQFLTTVDEVEALTGYDFFANIPDSIENAIEAGINGTNPPGTENQLATTGEDIPVEIVLNAVSPLATPTFAYTIMSQPAHGVLSGSGPAFTYTPAPNFHGSDSFTFRVHDDGPQGSNTSTVSITVTEVNDAPTANSQSATTNSNTPVSVMLSGTDFETAAGDLVFDVTVNPAHGTLSGAGTNLTYTPNANYSGPDSFEFTVRDTGDGASAALTSATGTVTITVNDTVAPSITAPAPTSVNATASGHAVIPDVVAETTASDNAGPVTVTQSPVAGTTVGIGTHTITLTATDGAGNTSTATTTFTVIDGRLTFSLSVSPAAVKRGKMAKLDIAYANTTSERLSVSFTIRYTSPCGSFVLDEVGPVQINAGTDRNANVNFHVPKTACTGLYTLTLEAYVGGVLVGTTPAELTVLP